MRKLLLQSLALIATVVAVGCSGGTEPLPTTDTHNQSAMLRNVPAQRRIPGAYIVVLNDEIGNVPEAAANMAQAHGLAVGHVYEHAVHGFAAEIPDARLQAMLDDDRVAYIEPDQEISTCAQTLPWGIDVMGADSSFTSAGNGAGSVDNVYVYVIDTGIQTNHPDLNVVGGRNFLKGKVTAYTDGNGHGTHVAGTIAARDNGSYVVGVAPGAPLYAIRVLDNNGNGTTSGVIAGVDYVTQQKQANPGTPMVANMSLGGSPSSTLDQAVRNCINAGVVVCVAAGNDGIDAGNQSPARVTEAITVGAHDASNVMATFSNFGSVVDINAPGVSILSTWKGSTTNTISGTSMATPHVTGAAALYLSTHPAATPAATRDAIVNAGAAWVMTNRPNTTSKTVRVQTF